MAFSFGHFNTVLLLKESFLPVRKLDCRKRHKEATIRRIQRISSRD